MPLQTLFILFGAIFIIGYALIALEHKTHINKSGVAIIIGCLLWILAAMFSHDRAEISYAIAENSAEIFAIVVFLLSAMTIVEILVHYQFFDWIRE